MARVMEHGVLKHPESGAPQDGVASPMMTSIHLHEVLDALRGSSAIS
jgi:hypothetical protein